MSDHDDTEMREFTRGLFATRSGTGLFSDPAEPDQPIEPAVPGNHVAREGSNPNTTPTDPFREFVADLFGIDENARGLNTTPLD